MIPTERFGSFLQNKHSFMRILHPEIEKKKTDNKNKATQKKRYSQSIYTQPILTPLHLPSAYNYLVGWFILALRTCFLTLNRRWHKTTFYSNNSSTNILTNSFRLSLLSFSIFANKYPSKVSKHWQQAWLCCWWTKQIQPCWFYKAIEWQLQGHWNCPQA